MHAHTTITSRDNYNIDTNIEQENNASLRIGNLPTGYTGRTFQSSGPARSNFITSPTGGGSQRQPINTVLGKHVDDDDLP